MIPFSWAVMMRSVSTDRISISARYGIILRTTWKDLPIPRWTRSRGWYRGHRVLLLSGIADAAEQLKAKSRSDRRAEILFISHVRDNTLRIVHHSCRLPAAIRLISKRTDGWPTPNSSGRIIVQPRSWFRVLQDAPD